MLLTRLTITHNKNDVRALTLIFNVQSWKTRKIIAENIVIRIKTGIYINQHDKPKIYTNFYDSLKMI